MPQLTKFKDISAVIYRKLRPKNKLLEITAFTRSWRHPSVKVFRPLFVNWPRIRHNSCKFSQFSAAKKNINSRNSLSSSWYFAFDFSIDYQVYYCILALHLFYWNSAYWQGTFRSNMHLKTGYIFHRKSGCKQSILLYEHITYGEQWAISDTGGRESEWNERLRSSAQQVLQMAIFKHWIKQKKEKQF